MRATCSPELLRPGASHTPQPTTGAALPAPLHPAAALGPAQATSVWGVLFSPSDSAARPGFLCPTRHHQTRNSRGGIRQCGHRVQPRAGGVGARATGPAEGSPGIPWPLGSGKKSRALETTWAKEPPGPGLCHAESPIAPLSRRNDDPTFQTRRPLPRATRINRTQSGSDPGPVSRAGAVSGRGGRQRPPR